MLPRGTPVCRCVFRACGSALLSTKMEPLDQVRKLFDVKEYGFDEGLAAQQRLQAARGLVLGIVPGAIESLRRGFYENVQPGEIADFQRWTGMGSLVETFVKPLTKQRGCAMLDLFFGVTVNNVPAVGPASDFFSYTWHETPFDTFKSVLAAFEDRLVQAYVWWDIFCQVVLFLAPCLR